MKEHLKHVKNYQPGKPLEELQREYGIRHAIKLASNENALGPSPKAVAAGRRALKGVHRYPDGGCFYLRRKLARFLKVAPKTLVFGNGSDEILVMATRAFAGPDDEVLIADPTFLIYEIAATVERARVIKVPMRSFRYDLEAMRRRLSGRTKVVFIANPDNPVGTYIPEKELVAFLKAVPAGAIVVLDEAYYEFAKDSAGYPDSLKLLKNYKNLIVTRTFSKAYGLSGLRVGYGVADPSVIAALNKVREPFNVNLVAQAAALAALDDKAHLRRTLRAVADGRKFLSRELKRLGFEVVDTVTNFMLVRVKRDAKDVYEKLLRKGVIVRSMAAWGLGDFIRVTIGKPAENRKFIKALTEVVSRQKSVDRSREK
ncbi:MAG: histidinol-phosphate transaminase [Candidatus Omnitrophica bacterium]|nr:histidinol-phosphate transaminase [Candidatus Omnitrophota bacterium]